jgi:hypothetical protein
LPLQVGKPPVAPAAPRTAPAAPQTPQDRLEAEIQAATPDKPFYAYRDGKISNALVVDLPNASPEAVFARLKQGEWPKFWPHAAMTALEPDGQDGHVASFDFHPNADAEHPFTIHERVTERTETNLHDGKLTYKLDVALSGDFEGQGRYELTRLPNGGTRLKAIWDNVKPPAGLPADFLALGFQDAHLTPMIEAFGTLNKQLQDLAPPDRAALEAQADDDFAELARLQ